MNTRCFIISLILLISLLVSGCTPSAPTDPAVATATATVASTAIPSEQSNPADRFAGTWTGTMSMTEDPTLNAVAVVTIPMGCSTNETCGDAVNTANGCKWEMTLVAVNSDVFEYVYSKSLEGDCAASGGGTLTLNPDGTLFREHIFPDFTISGTLTRQ